MKVIALVIGRGADGSGADGHLATSSGELATSPSEDSDNQMLEDINLVLRRFPDVDPNDIYARLLERGVDNEEERVDAVIADLERNGDNGVEGMSGTNDDMYHGMLQQGLKRGISFIYLMMDG